MELEELLETSEYEREEKELELALRKKGNVPFDSSLIPLAAFPFSIPQIVFDARTLTSNYPKFFRTCNNQK